MENVKFAYEKIHIGSKIYKLVIDYVDTKQEVDSPKYPFGQNPPMQATYKTILVKKLELNEATNTIEINPGIPGEVLSLPMSLEVGNISAQRATNAELYWDEEVINEKVVAFNKGQKEKMIALADRLFKIDQYYADLIKPETHRKKDIAIFRIDA